MENGLDDFFYQKRVLITGHTGFIGTWLALILYYFKADVIGYALAPEKKNNLFDICGLDKKITSYISDIMDLQDLKDVVKRHRPEIVIHLAAQTLVIRSYKEPIVTYSTNVIGTLNVFEACRCESSVKVIINVTSDKCYDNINENTVHREGDRLGGHDIYSSSKACSEILTESYRNSFFSMNHHAEIHQSATAESVGLSSVRAGNVIGGGDWSDYRIVPDCIRYLLETKPISIRNPYSVRPWQHVIDCLYGYLLLAKKMHIDPEKYSQAWNFGPYLSDEVRVVDVVKDIIDLWGSGEYIVDNGGVRVHESGMLKIDSSKAMNLLNWKPNWQYPEAIRNTIVWYNEFYNNRGDFDRICSFTMNQIKEYFEGS